MAVGPRDPYPLALLLLVLQVTYWLTGGVMPDVSVAYEYKVVEIREKVFGGKMSGAQLERR